ncbi:MAG TPA: 50S ribosomal protein L4 [Candidatus Limnocylindria bacterium]|nr:50S ribosomal protein L4 [Candidatus Limnocylindria bacterium]
MAEKKTTKTTAAAKKPAADKKDVKKTTAAKPAATKTTAKAAAPKAVAKRAVARPVTRTAAPRPQRPEREEQAPAQPRREREVRPLPQAPAGHAALIGAKGSTGETIALPESLTTTKRRSGLLFQAFNAARANARQGTAATKNRARVKGGGAKPWAQKGTGRSRQGSTRSPLWRHGGVVFGPNGRTYWQRLPEKMRRAAFAEAFADQASRGRVLVFDALPNGDQPKTSAMHEWLAQIGDTGKTVIVADGVADTAGRALANLTGVQLRSTTSLQLSDLLNGETLLVARGALGALERRAGAETAEAAR